MNETAALATSRTAMTLMAIALRDPRDVSRERLASMVAGPLVTGLLAESAGVTRVIEQLVAPEVMEVWGVSALDRMVRRLAGVADAAPGAFEMIAKAVWGFEEVRSDSTRLGESAILPLSSNREQDLEQARFGIGQAFPSLLEAHPVRACSLFADLAAVAAPSIGGEISGSGGFALAFDLQFSGGFGAIGEMADAVVRKLRDLSAPAGSDAADAERASTFAEMFDVLFERVRNTRVWERILGAAAQFPETLGLRLFALLDGQALIGHPALSEASSQLVAALSPQLAPEQHARLERMILSVPEQFPEQGDAASRRSVDALIARLDESRVVEDATRARLEERTAPEASAVDNPASPAAGAWWGLPLPHTEGAAEDEPAVRLRDAIYATQDAINRTLVGTEAERVNALRELTSHFEELVDSAADQPDRDEQLATHAREVAVGAAELLASDDAVVPGTPLGDKIARVLVSESRLAGATRGLVRLLRRPAWSDGTAGGAVRAAVRDLLDDPNAQIRMYASEGLRILVPDTTPLIEELSARLLLETETSVRSALLSVLFSLPGAAAREVDGALRVLSESSRFATLSSEPEPSDVDVTERTHQYDAQLLDPLLRLALIFETPFAASLVDSWAGSPADHPARLSRLISVLRPAMNPPTDNIEGLQARCFALLFKIVAGLVEIWKDADELLAQSPLEDDERSRLSSTVFVGIALGKGALSRKRRVRAASRGRSTCG